MLHGVLGVLINELLVVCDDRLGDGLTDGIDLGCVSTTGNSDADVDILELLNTGNQKRLVDLESKDLGLDEAERLSVDLDESLTSLFPSCQYSSFSCIRCGRSCRSYLAVGDGGGYSISVSITLSADCGIVASLPVFFLPKHCTR